MPKAGGGAELVLRPMAADEHDLELFRRCFAKNSPRPRSPEALRWQYRANTTDRLYVDLALPPDGRELAAIYASLPGWMRIGGTRRLALQSLDTLTDEGHRGRGLFVTLAKRTFSRATDDGVSLVYGFPNGNSAHGFFKKLGWQEIAPIPFLIRPIRTSYLAERLGLKRRLGRATPLARRLPDLALVRPAWLGGRRMPTRTVELRAADERITALWERFAVGIDAAIERDARYVQWRLFDRPDTHYRVLAAEAPDGALTALVAYTVERKHGGRIGYVMELLHDRTVRGQVAATSLLGHAVRAMADEGADAVLAWAFPHTPTFPLFALTGFAPLPERLRPIELHFGVRAFDPQLTPLVGRRESWYLSYLDSDTV